MRGSKMSRHNDSDNDIFSSSKKKGMLDSS
jgi:hypothetical protein